MTRRGGNMTRSGRTLLLGMVAAAIASAGASAPEDPYEPSLADISLPKGVKTLLPSHPKIDDSLYAVMREVGTTASKGPSALQDLKARSNASRANPIFLSDKKGEAIQVYIALESATEADIDRLRAAGVEIEHVSTRRPLVQGWAAISDIEAIAEMKFVREVRLPSYAIPTASGQVTTEGEILTGIVYIRRDQPRGAGSPVLVDGRSATVAVFSTSLFAQSGSLAAQKCGPFQVHDPDNRNPEGVFLMSPSDLPAPASCDDIPGFGFFGDILLTPPTLSQHVFDPNFGDSGLVPYPEGSAMLEVVHDLAPEAALYYGAGKTSLGLEANRAFLIEALAVPPDVVVENVVFIDEGRFDGSSAVSRQATDYARERNIHYFVSVGGVTPPATQGLVAPSRFPLQASDFFRGDPRNNRARVHSWTQGVTTVRDEGLNFETSEPIDLTLVWDDYWSDDDPAATLDLDMYLVPRSSLSLNQAVAASVRVQNGNASNPIERLTFFPTGSTPPLALVIVRDDGTENSRTLFTLVIESGVVSEPQYLTHGVPLNNSDALSPVVSVGDIDVQGDFDVSSFAIPGTTPGNPNVDRFFKWYESQESPTIVSYGGVRTRTTDLYPPPTREGVPTGFSGSSAAAAHMAGFAALLRHRFPQMPTYRLGELLSDTSGLDDEGNQVIPFAIDVTPDETRQYENHPVYRRTNPLALYMTLDEGVIDPYGFPPTKIDLPLPKYDEILVASAVGTDSSGLAETIHGAMDLGGDSPDGWTSTSGSGVGDIVDMGLRLTGGTGAWKSPLLSIQTPDDSEPRTTLRADRMYLLEARVGSSETDPLRVPDFRLSVESAGQDETWSLTVANNTEGVANAPTTLGGRTYQVFFTPSTQQIADAGFTFLFERIDGPGDNSSASLILRDVTLRELPLPEDPADLP